MLTTINRTNRVAFQLTLVCLESRFIKIILTEFFTQQKFPRIGPKIEPLFALTLLVQPPLIVFIPRGKLMSFLRSFPFYWQLFLLPYDR